jgi:hypothetical protein
MPRCECQQASTLDGRLLRVLDIIGLSQNVTTELELSITPAGKHQTHTITRTTKVL